MAKLIQELELKFNIMEAGIRDKTTQINSIYSDQERKLNENFSNDNLLEKYSNGLNDHREILLKPVSTNFKLEIEHVNEILSKNNFNKIDLSKELNQVKVLQFRSNQQKWAYGD